MGKGVRSRRARHSKNMIDLLLRYELPTVHIDKINESIEKILVFRILLLSNKKG